MAMQYEGKTYRNLQEQVGYLTRMYQDLGDRIEELRAQIPSKMIVEELPEEGDPLITYYVGPKGTAPNQYYEVWIWVQEEEDGPFVWRELEDTDQVDLSGYLEKDETTTTDPQAYIKNADGTQGMKVLATSIAANSIALRDADGRTKVGSPSHSQDAANKGYVDNGFVAKQTGVTTYPQVYSKNADGTQGMEDLTELVSNGAIVLRDASGQVYVRLSPTYEYSATSRKYVVDGFVAKQTGSTSYPQVYGKNTDGSQLMFNVSAGAQGSTIPMRRSDGNVAVPLTPSENGDAASKAYVDAAVGQLLYLHDIEIIVTVDATNKLWIKAYLINGSSTAITSFDRILYKRIYVQWGAYGQSIATAEPCSVSKLPDGFRNDEFDNPHIGFLYQYISGGNLISEKTDNSMLVTATDSVITF